MSTPPNVSKKRKRVSKACIHCRKSHLSCDEGRPCQRCIKKGLGDSCEDGEQKKRGKRNKTTRVNKEKLKGKKLGFTLGWINELELKKLSLGLQKKKKKDYDYMERFSEIWKNMKSEEISIDQATLWLCRLKEGPVLSMNVKVGESF